MSVKLKSIKISARPTIALDMSATAAILDSCKGLRKFGDHPRRSYPDPTEDVSRILAANDSRNAFRVPLYELPHSSIRAAKEDDKGYVLHNPHQTKWHFY